MKWCTAVTVVAIPSQKEPLIRQIVSARTALVSRPFAYSAAYMGSPFDFASHLATRMLLAIAIISRLL